MDYLKTQKLKKPTKQCILYTKKVRLGRVELELTGGKIGRSLRFGSFHLQFQFIGGIDSIIPVKIVPTFNL